MTNEKKLFTPGPLSTSADVKRAMLRDLGSRDAEFLGVVARVRDTLLELGGVSSASGYEAVLMQGSGTFGIESVIASGVPQSGRLLVPVNGAYGERIAAIARAHGIEVEVLRFPEERPVDPDAVAAALAADDACTDVALVHCETSTGMLNPVTAIGPLARRAGKRFIVDAMSAFGAIPLDLEAACVDYLITSANKCIQGVPGFSVVLFRRDALAHVAGPARVVSLDLRAQWQELERSGQFRFTPPTHAILAFDRALAELRREGGVEGRGSRYRANHALLVEGMRARGFQEYLPAELQSFIITAFLCPPAPFRFDDFYKRLNERGFVLYPGKVTEADTFRIGTIGDLHEADIRALLEAMDDVLAEMGVRAGVQ